MNAASGVLGWIVVGLVAGVLAKLVMPGKDPGGLVATVLIGMAGAILAGYVGRTFEIGELGQATQWISATVGAIVLLGAYRLVMGARR